MRVLRLIVLPGLIVGITAFLTFGSSGWAHPEGPHTKEQLVEHMNELIAKFSILSFLRKRESTNMRATLSMDPRFRGGDTRVGTAILVQENTRTNS